MKRWIVSLFLIVVAGSVAAGARDHAGKGISNTVVATDAESAVVPNLPPASAETERKLQDTQENAEMQVDNALAIVVPLPPFPADADEQLVQDLGLSPAQITAMKAQVEEERRKSQPLIEDITRIERRLVAITLNGKFDEKEVRELAENEAHILQELIICNVRLETELYKMLTDPQRRRIDELRVQAIVSGRQ